MMKIFSFIALFFLVFLVSCQKKEPQEMSISTPQETPITQTAALMETPLHTTLATDPYTLTGSSYQFNINDESIRITPIAHATLILEWADQVLYIDPAEALESYTNFPKPTAILVTHEHGDHLNPEVLEALMQEEVALIVNPGVFEKISPELQKKAQVMKNGDILDVLGFTIEAVPAYNVREEAQNYHPKGRDNGYVIQKNDTRIYISGDSEDTPEMRVLSDIDLAFISMNLPYTMPVESAIS